MRKNVTRDKVRGMFVGGAIGDALGMGVETWTPEKILEVHPQGIKGYVAPIGHKWFKVDEMPAGSTTDDTQLTIATAQGIINGHQKAVEQKSFIPYLDAIAQTHVAASKASIAGWGKSTVEACVRLANGVSWKESGKTTEEHRGTGNGIPMKCSPLAVWNASVHGGRNFNFNQRIVDYAAMTHWNQISAFAGVVHTWAVYLCLFETPDTLTMRSFFDSVADVVWEWNEQKDAGDNFYDVSHLTRNKDDLQYRLIALRKIWRSGDLRKKTVNELREMFGNGSCYVYDSLPFAYAFFVRNPLSVQTLLDVCEAGGDTDTNAKIVGEMMGALNGLSFFQLPENKWTIEGLPQYNDLVALADTMCDTLEIQ